MGLGQRRRLDTVVASIGQTLEIGPNDTDNSPQQEDAASIAPQLIAGSSRQGSLAKRSEIRKRSCLIALVSPIVGIIAVSNKDNE
mgnify:CR=1 FL=1